MLATYYQFGEFTGDDKILSIPHSVCVRDTFVLQLSIRTSDDAMDFI